MKRGDSLLRVVPWALVLAVACLVLAPACAQERGVQTYMVPMRDGVELATDVRLGAGDGPWPVVLLRTPYSRKVTLEGWDRYALVIQDVRGRFDSQGYAMPFFDDGWGERQDGLDTVKWILAQPWCNGKVGTLGASALGITQNMLAGTDPPGVLCQHINVASGDLYRALYTGGVFRQALAAGWLEQTNWPPDNLALMLAHPAYDDLWHTVNSDARVRAEGINIPAVHIGGWFDIFAQGTLDSFMTRSQIAANQWLIMGPWPHGRTRQVGELEFPANALEVPWPLHQGQEWFDFWLRGQDDGVRQAPRVQYYVMGACGEEGAPGNEWRTAASWPVAARATEYFLHADGHLSPRPGAAASRAYTYDPANPVPTKGGANLLIPAGSMDQSELEPRPDVLVFSTPPLEQPLEVTGRVRVRLYAASDARDTVFTAKLCDVYPDGRSMLLLDGALRVACRESFSNPTPIEPGAVYEFNLDLGSTSIVFNRGHRLRVAISSSNYPRFAAHPNVWGEGGPRVARQTVYSGGQRPSAVILPVVKGR